MSQHASKKPEGDEKKTRRAREEASPPGSRAEHEGPAEESLLHVGRADLLSDSRLGSPVNAAQRVQLMGELQRVYGNSYVQRLLAERGLQGKLTVNPPDDEYEREADRFAEAIVQGPGPQVQRQDIPEEEEELQAKLTDVAQRLEVRRQEEEEEEMQMKPDGPSMDVMRQEEEEEEVLQGKASNERIQRQEQEEEEMQMKRDAANAAGMLQRQDIPEEEEMQMKRAVSSNELQRQEEEELQMQVSDRVESRINEARTSGDGLPPEVAASFEAHFQRSLGDVRLHTDSEADNLSRQLGARAFTSGSDVFFRSGEYSPDSVEGKKLLGHELTHVVQQGGGSQVGRKEADIQRQGDEEVELKVRQALEGLDTVRNMLLSPSPNLGAAKAMTLSIARTLGQAQIGRQW